MRIPAKPGATRTPWNAAECLDVIMVYENMLYQQGIGAKYSKAQLVRGAMQRTGRTKGSIEAKLMNLSAVRASHGADYVTGYKPLSNAQKLLVQLASERWGYSQ